ncbi:MAG: shikimate dehydrogenase [bacterium]
MPEIKKIYAVIGDPVEHSVSPLIHNFIFQQLGLPYSYQKIKIETFQLKEFIIRCRENDLQGFNVTLPHKETIISLLDKTEGQARSTGAVNTVINKNSILKGFNTDVTGCFYALKKSSWRQTGRIVILGAGGACRAALIALTRFNPYSVTIIARSPDRAYELKKIFSDQVKFDIYAENIKFQNMEELLTDASVLINTTPVGMWPRIQNSPVPEPDTIPQHLIVFDMVPNPVYTTLLKQAKQRGAEIISGLSMLIFQAIASQEIWLNQKLPERLFDKVWTHLIEKMGT